MRIDLFKIRIRNILRFIAIVFEFCHNHNDIFDVYICDHKIYLIELLNILFNLKNNRLKILRKKCNDDSFQILMLILFVDRNKFAKLLIEEKNSEKF